MIARAILIMMCFSLSACAYRVTHSYKVPEPPAHSADNFYQPQMSQMSVQAYSYMLADELLASVHPRQLIGAVAVAGFVSEQSRADDLPAGHPHKALGKQLAASFIHELDKRGFDVVDYRVLSGIKMTAQGEQIWTNQVDELNPDVQARYLLSGTMTEHENGAVVNVRLLKAGKNQVVSTAQGFVPSNVFWSDEEVTLRDGFLVHKGERKRSF